MNENATNIQNSNPCAGIFTSSFCNAAGKSLGVALGAVASHYIFSKIEQHKAEKIIDKRTQAAKDLMREKETIEKEKEERRFQEKMEWMKEKDRIEAEIKQRQQQADILKMEAEGKIKVQIQHELLAEKLVFEERMSEINRRKYLWKKGIDNDSSKKANKGNLPNHDFQHGVAWRDISYKEMMANTPKGSPIIEGLIESLLTHGLGGPTSVGKSLILGDIAIAVSTGGRVRFLPGEVYAKKTRVLYYRLEVFAGELEKKYGDGKVFEKADILWRTRDNLSELTLTGLLNDIELYAQQAESDTLIIIDPLSKLPDYNPDVFFPTIEKIQTIGKAKGIGLTFLYSFHMDELKSSSPASSCNIRGSNKTVQQSGAFHAIRNERRGNEFKFLQVIKPVKGCPDKSSVSVCKIVKDMIDDKNWNVHLSYVDEKTENEALPLPTKPEAIAPHEQLPPTTPPQAADGNSSIDKVPHDVVQKMWEWYQKGVSGHGLKAVCKKFGEPYGLKYPTEISRLFEKHGFNVENKK